MDLKEFVSETILQIISGVADAQEQSASMGAKVNPELTGTPSDAVKLGYLKAEGGATQILQFDVALTATEGKGTKGGIGIVAGIVSLGSTGQSNKENASVSRVKFSVPLTLPKNRLTNETGDRPQF